jgi:hypothetical protein
MEGYLRISGASDEGNLPSKKRKMDQRNEHATPTNAVPVSLPRPTQPSSAARITRSQKELVDRMVDLPRSHLHKVLVDLIKQNPDLEEKIREKVANKRVKAGSSAKNDKVRAKIVRTGHYSSISASEMC